MNMIYSRATEFAIRILTAAAVGWSIPAQAAIQQEADRSIYIHVDDPRPVAKAATEMSRHYGYGISYEDPAYSFSDDLQDVTDSVSNQPSVNSASRRRVLVPAGRTLDVRLSDGTVGGREAVAAGLRQLLQAQASGAFGGRFRLEESQSMFHIVPTEVRGKNGDWVPQSSLLAKSISIPAGERTGSEMLRMIASAVSRATGQTVELGVMPLNAFSNARHFPTKSAPARDILIDLLQQSSPNLTWRLLYAPDLQRYYLSIVSFAKVSEEYGAVPGDASRPINNRTNEGILGDPTAPQRKSQ